MDYDEISKMQEPKLEMKTKFFESYFHPLLKNKNPGKAAEYFLNEAYSAWRIAIYEEHLKQTKFTEYLSEESEKLGGSFFHKIVEEIMSQGYEVSVRMEEGERFLFESIVRRRSKNDVKALLAAYLRFYKMIFENYFRLYSTIPYYYLGTLGVIKHQATDATSFVNVGAGEKYQAIKNITNSPSQGSFPDLCKGFDNQIRNAGEGHDRWEITDEDTALLSVIDPKTGKNKKIIELSEEELKNYIDECRRTVWILRNGLFVFLQNNPNIENQISQKREFRIREIEDYAKSFADNRWFEIIGFDLNKERSNLRLRIKYSPKIVGVKGKIFFGTAAAYDLVNTTHIVPYEYQMMDIIKYILQHLDKNNLPTVEIEMKDEKDQLLGLVEYTAEELKKLFIEEGEHQIPVPQNGTVPKKECKIVVTERVPYGMGETLQKYIDEK